MAIDLVTNGTFYEPVPGEKVPVPGLRGDGAKEVQEYVDKLLMMHVIEHKPQYELGGIGNSNGNNTSSSTNRLRTSGYIDPAYKGTPLKIVSTSGVTFNLRKYSLIDGSFQGNIPDNRTFVSEMIVENDFRYRLVATNENGNIVVSDADYIQITQRYPGIIDAVAGIINGTAMHADFVSEEDDSNDTD